MGISAVASDKKIDAPSGITREIAFRMAQIRKPSVAIPVEHTLGNIEGLGATINGSQIHSLRLPGYTISVEVIFGEEHERLTIRHEADSDPSPLLAIRKVRNYKGLVRGLDQIL